MQNFDVVVIGAGPAGYVAAIRAAQLGKSVACIEAETYGDPKGEVRLGGTCLNVGCIPSKALLQSSELFDQARHSFIMHGIKIDRPTIDLDVMMRRKENIVSQLTQGIRFLFNKNKITLLPGQGSLVNREDGRWIVLAGKEKVSAEHVIIATGSSARALPNLKIDNNIVCDNIGALSFNKVPKHLGVIGAGIIGLELGSVWKRLGSEVTILEALPTFLAMTDETVAREAWKILNQKQGLNIQLSSEIKDIQVDKKGVGIKYVVNDQTHTLSCDKLVVSIGRIPNTAGLNAQGVGLALEKNGQITVNERCQTNLENMWAVGDVVRGPMLAHKGMEEGIMVAECIAGQAGHVNYDLIPSVIYTHPEIAWVGKTEQELRKEGIKFKVGRVPFSSNGRALGQGETAGFVKLMAADDTDEVLGVHIIGPGASELISEIVMAMEFGASAEDIARTCHAHPTLSEVVHEAALAADHRAVHG